MDFDVDLPDLTCPDLFLISVERVTYLLIYSISAFIIILNGLLNYLAILIGYCLTEMDFEII